MRRVRPPEIPDETTQRIAILVHQFWLIQEVMRRIERVKQMAPEKAQALEELGLGESSREYWAYKLERITSDTRRELRQHVTAPLWVSTGFAGVSAAGIVAAIKDIRQYPTLASLYRRAGLVHTSTGEIVPVMFKGELRRALGFYTSMLRMWGKRSNFYKQFWLEQMAWYERERPQWPIWRQRNAARRVTYKLILMHVWKLWREALGLPAENAFIFRRGYYIPAPCETGYALKSQRY